MIAMSSFGNNGRLGNQLFQYAAMIGFSKRFNHEFVLPKWEYAKYFENEPPTGIGIGHELKEPFFHYNDRWQHLHLANEKDYNLRGYFQSERYFEHCKEDVRKAFTFKEDFLNKCADRLPKNGIRNIAIHVRRGDYVGNPNYAECNPVYWITALEHIPNWKKLNVLVFSDDPEYCKIHFGCFTNVIIMDCGTDIEDLCTMSLCDYFIIANSSFSWWAAWLREQSGFPATIIRPYSHFKGKLQLNNIDKDYYPERWFPVNFEGRKIILNDVTFVIPVKYDHPDRKQNFDLSIAFLKKYFDTNILVGEQGRHMFNYNNGDFKYQYFSDMKLFHRTKMLNDMMRACTTLYVANWDADIFVSPLQIWETVEKLRQGAAMVFPYDGRFARVHRKEWYDKLLKYKDVGIFKNTIFKGLLPDDNKNSHGGAVMFNRVAFFEGGGENENFISFGPEDTERNTRFTKLGFKVDRTPGILYHINHFRGPDSAKHHAHFKANRAENVKIEQMNAEELTNYIKTWPWRTLI